MYKYIYIYIYIFFLKKGACQVGNGRYALIFLTHFGPFLHDWAIGKGGEIRLEFLRSILRPRLEMGVMGPFF